MLEKLCGKLQTGHLADCSECSNEVMLDKSEGILWLAEQLLASQVALRFMDLAVSSGFDNCKGENRYTNYNIIRFLDRFSHFLL